MVCTPWLLTMLGAGAELAVLWGLGHQFGNDYEAGRVEAEQIDCRCICHSCCLAEKRFLEYILTWTDM